MVVQTKLTRVAPLAAGVLLMFNMGDRNRSFDELVTVRNGRGVEYTRLLSLTSEEGVFAYARISPDGRALAYASIQSKGRSSKDAPRSHPVQKVVDLATGKTLFAEPGVDAYWSLEGNRMIFLSYAPNAGVTIRHHHTGRLVRNAAPAELGDYFSWAWLDGRDLIVTVLGNYFFLDSDKARLPAAGVVDCPRIGGPGQRPLVSKDGTRLTTFVRGNVVVRSLGNCDEILDTGLQGAKADFSWNGRYIAFHMPKPDSGGYQIVIVDLRARLMRILPGLSGSSLFPSWTKDGRLCFRYDSDDYRGFMMASNVLSISTQPLPDVGPPAANAVRWSDVFTQTASPRQRVSLVMIWAPWSAHASYALEQLQRANYVFVKNASDVHVTTVLQLGSLRADADRLKRASSITLPELPVPNGHLQVAAALNQNPTLLLFRGDKLVDRRLGAQSDVEIASWVKGFLDSEQ